MPLDIFLALLTFAFVSSITPGPNNLMLLASGVNFGFRRTVPHMLGIGLGFTAMVALVGIGLAGVFLAWPMAQRVLQVVSVVYLLWLAWKIANAAPPSGPSFGITRAGGKPFTFLQAAAFQWVNPKAWTMALGATTLYAPGQELWAVLSVAAVFGLVNLPCVSSWALLGTQLRRFLGAPGRQRAFNLMMAALLVASLWPVIMG